MLRLLATVTGPMAETGAATSRNGKPPRTCPAVCIKITPEPVIVPSLKALPLTTSCEVPRLKVAPGLMVSGPELRLVDRVAALGVPAGIVTAVEADGTPVGVQLVAVSQALLTVPFQVCAAMIGGQLMTAPPAARLKAPGVAGVGLVRLTVSRLGAAPSTSLARRYSPVVGTTPKLSASNA